MDITADGLSIVTFDSGHVFAVELFMSAKNAFVRYQCTNHMSVTIKTEHLHKIFRTVRNNNDDVSLIADDEHIKVNIQRNDCNGANHRTVYEYTIAQMVVMNHERIIIDERNYACEVLMPTKLLADIICHNLKDMGERLRLSVSADCVTFEVVDEMLQAKITITNGELELAAFKNQHEPIMCTPSFGILCKEERSLQFKLAYFAKMGKAAKLTKGCEVLLQLDHDLPLSLLFHLEDDIGTLNFFLAPLIE
jgi:proliferating cell nuclear antigen PCNA